MRYTIRAGVEHPYSALASDSSRFILPLIVILAGVLYFGLHSYQLHKPASPLTLGIYTVKTPDNSGSSLSGSNSSGNSSDPSLSGSANQTGINPASLSSGSSVGSASSTVGGMGGGTEVSNPQSGGISATATTPSVD